MIMKVKRSDQAQSFSLKNNWRSSSRWICLTSVSWLQSSKEDHPKVQDFNLLSLGTLMGSVIERLWMLGLRKWKTTSMPPKLGNTRPWSLPNPTWRATPPHGGGRWGKRKGRTMATHGNFLRNASNRSLSKRLLITSRSANSATLWMRQMTIYTNMWAYSELMLKIRHMQKLDCMCQFVMGLSTSAKCKLEDNWPTSLSKAIMKVEGFLDVGWGEKSGFKKDKFLHKKPRHEGEWNQGQDASRGERPK